MSAEDRKAGYYWVRPWIKGSWKPGDLGPWIIGEWTAYGNGAGSWTVGGWIDDAYQDDEFANIGPMVTMPEGLPTEPDTRD